MCGKAFYVGIDARHAFYVQRGVGHFLHFTLFAFAISHAHYFICNLVGLLLMLIIFFTNF